MSDQGRIEEFRAEVEALKLKTASTGSERILQMVGAALMVVGVLVALIAYIASTSQNSGDLAIDNLEHNELQILAVAGLAATVAGGAMFLRYSLARFFRFWLLRQIYESRHLVEELRSGDAVSAEPVESMR